jgi:plasmid stability protein
MPSLVIRNLPEETHRALKERAKQHGNSTEAELRLIVTEAVKQRPEVGLGTELAAIAKKYGGWDLDIKRNKEPTSPAVFE